MYHDKKFKNLSFIFPFSHCMSYYYSIYFLVILWELSLPIWFSLEVSIINSWYNWKPMGLFILFLLFNVYILLCFFFWYLIIYLSIRFLVHFLELNYSNCMLPCCCLQEPLPVLNWRDLKKQSLGVIRV